MRLIFVILDGAADKGPITPLKKAKIPSLNYLGKNGLTGLIYSVKKGISPESDIGVMSLLGYNPLKYYTGRGPLEMYGYGIKFKKFLALRANFATAINNKIIDRRVGRTLTSREAKILANSINKSIKLKKKFVFLPTTEHRGILVFKENLPSDITNTDSAYIKKGLFSKPKVSKDKIGHNLELSKPLVKNAGISSSLVNEFTIKSMELLKNHPINKIRIKKRLLPANLILLRDAGNRLPNLPKKKNWISVSSMPLEIGISRLAGFKIRKVRISKKPDYYRNLELISNTAISTIKNNPNKNVYVHFKETDIPGHDGNFKEKVKMLEFLDKKFFSKLKQIKDSIIVVTSDHATPCSLKAHSADPVPLLVYGLMKKKGTNFNEIDCKKGMIRLNEGYKLLELINNFKSLS